MNLKRIMALIRSNIEPNIEKKLVLICPKLEPGKKEEAAQANLKLELQNNEGCFSFQILSLQHFALIFSK